MTKSTDHPDPPTTAPWRLTARSPDDFVAVARIVLGFTPVDSVVMLTFGAVHPFHARVDLPARADPADPADPADHSELRELADTLLEPAVRHGVAHVVFLVCTDDAGLGEAAWTQLAAGARGRGLLVTEALRVDDQCWFPLLGTDAYARRRGVAYDVTAHPFLARGVLEGRVTHPSRDDLARTLHPDAEAVARVAAEMSGLPAWPDVGAVPRRRLLAEGAWVQELVSWHVARGAPPSDAEVARLVRDVHLLRLRDAAWALITRPASRDHLRFWVDVLRRCPEPLAAPAAVLVAWSAWQAGDGALAWCGLDRCHAADPDYSLGHLLGQALTAAVPPSHWEGGFDWTEGL